MTKMSSVKNPAAAITKKTLLQNKD